MKMTLRSELTTPKTIQKIFADIAAMDLALQRKQSELATACADFYANARVEGWTITQIKTSMQQAYCAAYGVKIDALNFAPRPGDEDQTSHSKWSRLWRVVSLAGENKDFREELSSARSFNEQLKRSKEFKPSSHKTKVTATTTATQAFKTKVIDAIAKGFDGGLSKGQMLQAFASIMNEIDE